MVNCKGKPPRRLERTPLLFTCNTLPWVVVGEAQTYRNRCIVHEGLQTQDWLVNVSKKIHPGAWLYYVKPTVLSMNNALSESSSTDDDFSPPIPFQVPKQRKTMPPKDASGLATGCSNTASPTTRTRQQSNPSTSSLSPCEMSPTLLQRRCPGKNLVLQLPQTTMQTLLSVDIQDSVTDQELADLPLPMIEDSTCLAQARSTPTECGQTLPPARKKRKIEVIDLTSDDESAWQEDITNSQMLAIPGLVDFCPVPAEQANNPNTCDHYNQAQDITGVYCLDCNWFEPALLWE